MGIEQAGRSKEHWYPEQFSLIKNCRAYEGEPPSTHQFSRRPKIPLTKAHSFGDQFREQKNQQASV